MSSRLFIGIAPLLALATTASAGVYNTAEPPMVPHPDFRVVRDELDGLKGLVNTLQPTQLRHEVLAKVNELEARDRLGLLSFEDRINLGAYYLRLREPEKAVQVLSAAERMDRQNFMLLANLATAHHLAGRLERAISYERQALAAWPAVRAGFRTQDLYRYRRAEKYYLSLLQNRYQESIRPTGMPPALDPLFPKVRFVGPRGKYEPGTLAPEQWEELPPDAVTIVEQLVLWLPDDGRLLWQLAELLNAEGDVQDAAKLIDSLVFNNVLSTRELLEHRSVLKAAAPVAAKLNGQDGRAIKEQLLWAAAPRGVGLAPGIGPAMPELGWAAALETLSAGPLLPGGNSPPLTPSAPAAASIKVWHLAVTFLAGMLVALLLSMQFRESRRRRQAAFAAPGDSLASPER
jgi:hypothetical protein